VTKVELRGYRIDDNSFLWDDHYSALIAAVPKGQEMRIIIEPWVDNRRERASRLFHKIRDLLAEAQNEDKDRIKIALKIAYGVHERTPIKTPEGWRYQEGLKSTREYTIKEMGQLIEGAMQEAWEAGVDFLSDYIEYRDAFTREQRKTLYCMACGNPMDHWHHIKTRGSGGSDGRLNELDLCARCHSWIHQQPEKFLTKYPHLKKQISAALADEINKRAKKAQKERA
jgi:hypothetical protein